MATTTETVILRIPHLVGTNIILTLEDVYGTIGEICGINSLDGATPPDGSLSYKSPQQLCVNGIIRRAKVVLANKKIRTIYLTAANCSKIGALRTLEYTTGVTIKSAYFPQRFILS